MSYSYQRGGKMNCQEVNRLLVAYLDNEVTPSEWVLIRAHLAECGICQEELAKLSALQSRVSQFLQARATQVAPSPQAWSRLRARQAGACPERNRREARPSPSWLPKWLQRPAPGVGRINRIYEGGITMKKGFALTAVVALVIALSIIAFSPSVRAQVGELLRWFRFASPAGGGEVSIPGSVGFTPLRPAYLPEGFQAMAVGLNPEAASLNYWNSATNQILIIDEWLVPDGDKSLPSGTHITVKGQPAVLITGLEGKVDFGLLSPAPSTPVATPASSDSVAPLEPGGANSETVTYTDGKQLVWHAGNVRIEMVSNLSAEEMLKIAESMIPAEMGEGPSGSNP